jgi:O-antigen/teichoic acid export membrane protein
MNLMATEAVTSTPPSDAALLQVGSSELRHSIVSGMRWTLWLSVLSIPFSYGTKVLLARIGPEALGAFGVLTVYIGVVAVFFYLGGNAVIIRFLPAIAPEKRASFLASYLAVLLLAMLPWLALVTASPRVLELVFGSQTPVSLLVLLLYLSPVYVLFSVVTAALKAEMEIKWAQALNRLVPIGSFLVYALLFALARNALQRHYVFAVWSVYLVLTAVALFAGVPRMLRHLAGSARPLRFHLPAGFWKYTLGLQGDSTLGFLTTRLDLIFVLHAGGLKLAGEYVAITAVAGVVTRIVTFIADSFLPSLANTLARHDWPASRSVTETYLRAILPAVLAMSLLLLVFARPLLALMGGEYLGLALLAQLTAPIAALQSLSMFAGTVLGATGRSARPILAKTLRTLVFVPLFWFLWDRYQLLGAVLAWAVAETLQHFVLLSLLRYRPLFYFSMLRGYVAFLAVLGLASAGVLLRRDVSLLPGTAACLAALLLFFFLSRYTAGELKALARLYLPLVQRG